jgi:hypothetical protein
MGYINVKIIPFKTARTIITTTNHRGFKYLPDLMQCGVPNFPNVVE